MTCTRLAVLVAALALSSGKAMAQADPVITKVVFSANAPRTVVANASSQTGAITAGGCSNAFMDMRSAHTCSGSSITITGCVGSSAPAFIMNGASKNICYTKTAPQAGSQQVTMNILIAGANVFSAPWGSGKLTVTVAANGSPTFTLN